MSSSGFTAPGETLGTCAPLRAVRGSIVITDHVCLREQKLLERYSDRLPEDAQRILFGCTATDWLEVPIIMSHYRALDALELNHGVAFSIGVRVGTRVHGAFLRTLLQLAGQLGTSPWSALGQAEKLWARSWRGGALRVTRNAERSALVAILGTPPCASAFFRSSFAGAVQAGIAPLCRAPHVTEDVRARGADSYCMNVRWD